MRSSLVLEAVVFASTLMGATTAGVIRRQLGTDVQNPGVYGSIEPPTNNIILPTLPEWSPENTAPPDETTKEPDLSPENPPSGGAEVVAYFGQLSNGEDPSNHSLALYCQNPNIDILVIGFVNSYQSDGGLPGVNLAGYGLGYEFPGTKIAAALNWEKDIPACQAAGKKILISIGGESAGGSIDSDELAVGFANNIWGMFGEGTGLEDKRPFGSAVVDGFDFDIENKNPAGIPKAIETLRNHFKDSSRGYVITAAPQCPRPDASLGDAVYLVDKLFIQFYNNPMCANENFVSSFIEWSDDIASKSPSTKIYAGFPGSPSHSAGSGYVTPQKLKQYVSEVRSLANFGGVMVWEATYAANNFDGGKSYLEHMREAVAG